MKWINVFNRHTGMVWEGRLNDYMVVSLRQTDAVGKNWAVTLVAKSSAITNKNYTNIDLESAKLTAIGELRELGWIV